MDVDDFPTSNLDQDLQNSDRIVQMLRQEEGFDVELYSALCNMGWQKLPDDPELRALYVLKYQPGANIDDLDDKRTWSCTWRYAGGLIASIRNRTISRDDDYEDYMDYYCTGFEGTVTDRVEEELNKLGWRKAPWRVP